MAKVSVTIDGKKVSVPADSTILEAAEAAGIRIPTLCHVKELNPQANCRVCLVEVKGSKTLESSCAVKVRDGMEVMTDTPEVRDARKMSLELILSNHSWDCHHCLRIGNYTTAELSDELCSFCFFCDCVKDGDCELQALALEYDINQLPFPWPGVKFAADESTGAVARNMNKCIKCRRCIETCSNVQTVGALGVQGRGADMQVVPTFGRKLADSECVNCGKCIESCPTGAIYAKEDYEEMLSIARLDAGRKTVVQVSPSIKSELARLWEMSEAEVDLARMASGLRKIGIDYVVAEDAAAAMAQAEAAEKLGEKLGAAKGPVLLSNSAAAIEFIGNVFPEMSASLVTYPSAEQQFGKIAKGAWAKENGFAPESVMTVTLSEDASYKAEALQDGMKTGSLANVDFVLTPREVARLFNKTAVDITQLDQGEFDPLVKGGGAKTPLAELLGAKQGGEAVREVAVNIGGKKVKAAVAQTLGAARQLLEQAQAGNSPYSVIRVCS